MLDLTEVHSTSADYSVVHDRHGYVVIYGYRFGLGAART